MTFGGHPVQARGRAQEHRDHEARAASSSACASNEADFRADARAAARPADRRRRARLRLLLRARAGQGQGDARELRRGRSATSCCAASSRRELFERGLICRADDRGDPVVQISPPLVAGPGGVRVHRVARSAPCWRRPASGCAWRRDAALGGPSAGAASGCAYPCMKLTLTGLALIAAVGLAACGVAAMTTPRRPPRRATPSRVEQRRQRPGRLEGRPPLQQRAG